MRSAPSTASRLHGVSVAACSAAVAVAAHGAAGGHPPTGAGLMLVLAASATVGAVSAAHRGTTAPRLRLLGFLGLGQLLGHIALSIGGTHAHAAVPAAPMLTAHVLAALLCAALILLSEQLCQVLGSVLRHSAGTGGWMLGRDGAGVPAYRFALITEVLASGTGNRGPPVVSPAA